MSNPEHITAWLGPFADDTTVEQRADLAAAFAYIEARYPGDDQEQERLHATSGAGMIILGDDTLEGIGGELRTAKAAERAAMETLTGAMIAAHVQGVSEMDITRAAGLSRPTVRRALSKRS